MAEIVQPISGNGKLSEEELQKLKAGVEIGKNLAEEFEIKINNIDEPQIIEE